MDLSIVIPLLNEEESLPELAQWIEKVMNENKFSYEVLFIDDGSKDNIIDNLVSEIENEITTDGEVDVLGSVVEKYGLQRAMEVKKVETDIEFF